jgi:hypothetical protein
MASGFANAVDIASAHVGGRQTLSSWRKQPTQATASGIWFDLSMSPGNPVPNYYAASPMISVAMRQSTDGGLYHGGAVAPLQKVLRRLTLMSVVASAVPLPVILLDYLLFYPFIDESILDPQPFTNSVPLPRYATGAGVQMMAVVVAGQTGGQQFRVEYTNSDGVAGRISQTVQMTTQAVNGTILTSAPATALCNGPFIPLQTGDTGVRSIDSVTILGVGDVGLFTLVLVKPIATTCLRGIDAPTEVDFLVDHSILPMIQDDAYLNFICHPSASLANVPIHGLLETVWN